MVRFSGPLRTPTDYWKLSSINAWPSRYSLQKALSAEKYRTKAGASKERLHYLMTRCERGLLSYDGCTGAELRHCCKERGYGAELKRNARKHDLVANLERHDEQATFDRWSKLPTELRVRIYELYFGSLGFDKDEDSTNLLLLDGPEQPPITHSCPSIRDEALPVFYQSCFFRLEIYVTPQRLYLDPRCERFFRCMPQSCFRYIRRLALSTPTANKLDSTRNGRWLLDFSSYPPGPTRSSLQAHTGASFARAVTSPRMMEPWIKGALVLAVASAVAQGPQRSDVQDIYDMLTQQYYRTG